MKSSASDAGRQRLFSKAVRLYLEEQQAAKAAKESFDKAKKKCVKVFEEYFAANGKSSEVVSFCECVGDSGKAKVTMVKKMSVSFDADKLEKALGKKKACKVINKKYIIVDMQGLISYMKSLGADPSIFKSFLQVEKSVNKSELDRLEEIGEVSVEQIDGCYTVQDSKPYFTVKVVGGYEE